MASPRFACDSGDIMVFGRLDDGVSPIASGVFIVVQIVADGSATALALLAHIIDAAGQGLQSTKNLEIMVNALLRNACW